MEASLGVSVEYLVLVRETIVYLKYWRAVQKGYAEG